MRILKKHCSEPWLEYIHKGIKTFEGRLNVSPWNKIRVGECINFINENRSVFVEIISVEKYLNFEEAFNLFEGRLLPGVYSVEKAKDVYREFFSDDKVEEHGVLIFEMRLLEL